VFPNSALLILPSAFTGGRQLLVVYQKN